MRRTVGLLLLVLVGQVLTGCGGTEGAVHVSYWDKPTRVEGREVRVAFFAGLCDAKRWVEVEETSRQVVLTAKHQEPSGDVCSAAERAFLVARLEKPLGDRTLVDGACLRDGGFRSSRCPEGPWRGTCHEVPISVDSLVDEDGRITLRLRGENATPRQRWQLRWTSGRGEDAVVARERVAVDAAGGLTAARSMGRVSPDGPDLLQLELAPVGQQPCSAVGRLPVSYGS